MKSDEHKIIEKLIRSLSHELKNPLTTLNGYAQLLGMKSSDMQLQNKSRTMIIQQVNRIDQMLKEMYEIFNLKSDTLDDLNLLNSIDDVKKEIEKVQPGKIAVSDIPDSAHVTADRDLFKRMLMVLLRGFDWENNPETRVSMGYHSENGREGFKIIFSNIDFSDLDNDTFFLPYVSKRTFIKGTELYETSVIAMLFGWDVVLIISGNNSGFGVLF